MKIIVTRNKKTADGIFGVLTIDSSLFTCFSVENLEEAIPVGIWKVTFDYSPRFNRILPHIWVPERDAAAKARGDANAGLRLHPANYPNQLDGCVAVGDKEEPDAVDNSVITFNKFYKIIEKADDLTIEIKEAFNA